MKPKPAVTYRLCPRCFRAVAEAAEESYCPNDGEKLLAACPRCEAPITSPYSHFCVKCGFDFALRASAIGSWGGA
jgi:predicted RNA-binding Zn-ribbon protein involved in translation (DUF1610 family)